MKITLLSILVLMICSLGQSQTKEICGSGLNNQDIRDGWVVTKMGEPCPNRGSACRTLTLTNITGMAPGSQVDICGNGVLPVGWISTTVVEDRSCVSNCGVRFFFNRIIKLKDMAPGSKVDICIHPDSLPPQGWVIVERFEPRCGGFGGVTYKSVKIQKIECMAIGSEVEICDSNIPPGWEVVDQTGIRCGEGFFKTRIKNITAGEGQKFYRDADQDGFGNPDISVVDCKAPDGYVANQKDCDDTNPNINPNAAEIPDNSIDDNCNGSVDEASLGRCCNYRYDGTVALPCKINSFDACERLQMITAAEIETVWSEGGDCSDPCVDLQLNMVNVSSFEGLYAHEKDEVKISWQMDNGMKARRFNIERSRDGQKFKTIGLVNVQAGSNDNAGYSFSDINPYKIGYYRLRWISSSKLNFSQVVTIVSSKTEKLMLVPNPATGNVKAFMSKEQLTNAEISVMDITGRVVLRQKLGGSQHELNTAGLKGGIYTVTVKLRGQVFVTKMIKNGGL